VCVCDAAAAAAAGAGEVVKPTVVHRDVNSRNILVKADLSLCLCDFGFAMKIATSCLAQSNDEHSSLADVRSLMCLTFGF